MNVRWSLLFVSLIVAFTACQSLVNEVDPAKLPKTDSKLVVNCYISPQDTVLAVAVAHSQPVLGVDTSGLNLVSNATVVLSDGTQSITIPYDPQQSLYVVDARALPIVVGKTYQLQVSAGGFATVIASCTVPKEVPISSISLDSTQGPTRPDGTQTWDYYVRALWQDPAGETNFYRVVGAARFTALMRGAESATDTVQRPVVLSAAVSFGRSEQYVSDRNQDGQTIASSRVQLPTSYSASYSYRNSDGSLTYGALNNLTLRRPLTVIVDVLHTDETYYHYHYAVQQQRSTGSNPFAEPVLVPTNVAGGLGCFAAYNRSRVTTVLR